MGRFVERDDTFAGSHALPRHAAGGTAAGWRAHLRCAAAWSRAADTAERLARIDALVDVAVQIYAPLPGPCLSDLVRRLRFCCSAVAKRIENALQRIKQALAARVGGVDCIGRPMRMWRVLSARHGAFTDSFRSIVWDRERFELLWAGRTVSRLIRQRLNASSAITQCRALARRVVVGRISPWKGEA